MKIGFDSKRLFCNVTGLGNYSRSLVKNLHAFYPENEYNLYTSKLKKIPETSLFFDHPSFKTFIPKTPFKSYWRSFSIREQLEKDNIDLFHGLSNELPFNLNKSNIKSIVTIHDLIFKILPETYPRIDKIIYEQKFRNSCRKADRIIAISNNTKEDVIKFYDINPEKIEVIYQTCDPLFYATVNNNECDDVLRKYNIPTEYILFVGSVEKRKNLKVIIEAYKHLPPEFRIPIVVIGGRKGYEKEFHHLIKANKLEKQVHWVANLEDNFYLRSIYQKAMALVYPSLYEGFGLPVAEALLSKIPVITSRISSLPEAGGPKSFYVNPNDPEELANAIIQVLSDTELRKIMIADGYKYAVKTFSPERVTHQLVACYETTLQNQI